MDTMSVVILSLLGLGFGIAFVMWLASSPENRNGEVYNEAERIVQKEKDYAKAIQYVRAHAERDKMGWERLSDAVIKWEKILGQNTRDLEDEESLKVLYAQVGQHLTTTKFTPKKNMQLPEDELAMRVHAFLRRYPSSSAVTKMAGSEEMEPWITYRRILKEHALSDVDVSAMLRDTEGRAEAKAAAKRFGVALKMYESLKRSQSLLLKPDLYAKLGPQVDKKILRLQEQADGVYQRDMAEIDSMLTAERKAEAIGKLRTLIQLYGLERFVRGAKARLAELENPGE